MLSRWLAANARVELAGARPSRAVVQDGPDMWKLTRTVARLLGRVQSERGKINLVIVFPWVRLLSPLFYEDAQIFIFPRPHKRFRGPVFAGCRRGFRLKPSPDTKHDVPRLIRGAESQIIGVLVRTVLQLGFAVQSSGKKRCGRRVGELRKWVSACSEPTGSPACEPLGLGGVFFPGVLWTGGTGTFASRRRSKCQLHPRNSLQYVSRNRVQLATGLMKDSAQTLAQVASMSGFESYSTFAATFEANHGVSPARFRSGLQELSCESQAAELGQSFDQTDAGVFCGFRGSHSSSPPGKVTR
jgi:AraC-like DNA-binding protein